MRQVRFGRWGLIAIMAVITACGSDSTGPEFQVIEEVEFAPELGIDLSEMTRTSSGVYYLDVEVGEGEPATDGTSMRVGYNGYLTTGVLFDSGTTAFVVGSGNLIAGFDEGVRGMRLGGRRRIIIPPELGYGDQSYDAVPAGSILIFDVEFISSH